MDVVKKKVVVNVQVLEWGSKNKVCTKGSCENGIAPCICKAAPAFARICVLGELRIQEFGIW